MDSELSRLVDSHTPRLNPRLANGYACEEVRRALLYTDQLLKAAAPSFPPGLEYLSCQRCYPEEEYKYRTRADWRDKKRKFEVSLSDVYLAKFHFRFEGKAFTHYLYMPFVQRAGSFHVRGSHYFVVPVLIDQIITKKADRIFVRLMKTRFNVRREPCQYMQDGCRETVQLHYTQLFHAEKDNKRQTEKGRISLIHYLFCKYGFSGAFANFTSARPVVGGVEINPNTYPPSQWVICSSVGVVPRGLRKKQYRPNPIRVAVRHEEYTSLVRRFIGAFFYVADYYPERLKAQWVEEKTLWRILLGLFIFPLGTGEGYLQGVVERHLQWLDEYLDFVTLMKIQQLGWPVSNTFELFAYIVKNYDYWWLTSKARGATMYDKKLEVLYFLLGDIVQGVHRACFELRKPQRRALTLERVEQLLHRYLHPETIFKVRRNHSELQTFGTSGDNMATKITSKMVPQERYVRPNHKDEEAAMRSLVPHELLHASVAEVGSYLKLSRNSPDGRDNLNLTLQVDDQGLVLRNPAFVELLDETQQKIEPW